MSEADHVIAGRRPVAEALRSGRALKEVLLGLGDAPELAVLAAAARERSVKVAHRANAELDALCGGVVHQGAVALAPPFAYRSLRELPVTDLVVVCDGITDPRNLGAIARSAEAAGAGAMLLPRRRSGHVSPAAEKAAAGAFSWLPVVLVPNIARGLGVLADQGFWSVGLDEGAPPLWSSPLLDGNVAIVVGAEGKGLSRLVRERVDALVGIPMAGSIGSLNVSVASGIVLFEVGRRRAENA